MSAFRQAFGALTRSSAIRPTSLSQTSAASARVSSTRLGSQPQPFSSSSISGNTASSTPVDTGEQAIYNKLKAEFDPKVLEVQDVSGGCGSFYTIEISSTKFNGLGMVKQQKLVNEVLKAELKEIHGIQLKTMPEK